ncbi:MAG: Guanine nucleotide exchange factor lte1 [Bogoriella megaspora]|nr:MAG: Guanine nucleotide exchange factor lte1 [Bogoriella megaspora]
MAVATAKSQDPLQVNEPPVDLDDNPATIHEAATQNPRRVANIVRQRRRKDYPPVPSFKQNPENMETSLGGNAGVVGESAQAATITEGDAAGRDRSATQYTVGNIASGRIYLRPVERNDRNDRQQNPSNPYSSELDSTPVDDTTNAQNELKPRQRSRESFWSGTRTPYTPPPHVHELPVPLDDSSLLPRPTRKGSQRAHSFSTIDDRTHLQTDNGTFRIVIERPSAKRPKTADTNALSLLDVEIPHYRLGVPRFSMRGTATMRSSAYTRNSDADALRTSILSRKEYEMLFPGQARISLTSGNSSAAPKPLFARRSTVRNSVSTIQVPPPRKGYASITPAIYDALTAKPNDPAFVRFNATTQQITAATPARLVAHITSPSFLDYELLSDFFLTFRSYLSPADLVAYLIARLKWAVNRLDNFGRIVRVRTFVALRHWILNYFVDDFVPDRQLRIMVCRLVNNLYNDVKAREGHAIGDLKIIGELKKCWRRTCALYWDMPDAAGQPSLDDAIFPGGELGNRHSNVSQQSVMPAVNFQNPELQKVLRGPADDFHDLLASKSAEALQTLENAGLENATHVSVITRPESHEPTSPFSDRSLQVMSCSIPVRNMPRQGYPGSPDVPLFPHPVQINPNATTTSIVPAPQPVSTTQQTKSKPGPGHKRSGSFNDALRDERTGLSRQKAPEQSTELQFEADMMAAYPFTAGLIRGIVMQPVSPYIDDVIPLSPSVDRLELLDFESSDVVGILSHSGRVALANNPGVKKILGSVRRALSTRHGESPTRSDKSMKNGVSSSQLVPSNALTAPLSERRPKQKGPLRIDLLSAGVCESFRRAMVEEFEPDGRGSGIGPHQSINNVSPPRLPELEELARPSMNRFDSNVTVGSRSIVIMDDTQLPPNLDRSDAHQDHQLRDEVAARRSVAGLPRGAIHSMATVAPDDEFGATLEDMRVMDDTQRSSVLPASRDPISGPTSETVPVVMPLDQPAIQRAAPQPLSPTSPLVEGRASLRRYSSLHSGWKAPDPNSEVNSGVPSSVHTKSSMASPHPRRQLRRKPGGDDLKAARNVHDLEPIKRSRSTGSLSIASHSVTNSMVYNPSIRGSLNQDISRNSKTLLSNKTFAKEKPKSIGFIETHSSQPQMRPSFEKEVAKLANLPDFDEDGDVNVALAKLEGTYEKRSPDPELGRTTPIARPRTSPKDAPVPVRIPQGKLPQRDLPSPLSPRTDIQGASIYHMSHTTAATHHDTYRPATAGKASVADTEDSISSIPLLERGLSVHKRHPGAPADNTPIPISPRGAAMPSSPTFQNSHLHPFGAAPTEHSLDHFEQTGQMPGGGYMNYPHSGSPRASFLLDSDEELSDSDLSSDLSTEIGMDEHDRGIHSFYHHEPSDAEGKGRMSHPLHFPPTPPPTGGFPADEDPAQSSRYGRPPSPDPTPISHFMPTSPIDEDVTHHKDLMNLLGVPQPAAELQVLRKKESGSPQRTLTPNSSQPRLPVPSSSHSAHVPFILSYSSDVLAQQFTVIERDALDELDWKELVNLNFSGSDSSPALSSNETPRDWVEYLRTRDPRGLALITARFNIVVKWAISEILLIPADPPVINDKAPSSSHHTIPNAQASPNHNFQLRVSTIRKYIHIALACRRLRNFATMAQLVIALTSGDVARLAKTWDGVPKEEQAALYELERLVGPVGNFGRLRREMEGPAISSSSSSSSQSATSVGGRSIAEEEQGTIPFVGVYTHDLIYNAQKPPYLPSSTRLDGTSRNDSHVKEGINGEGLVNFERHHRAAGIVKNLLRLLESSGKYVVEMDRNATAGTSKGKGVLKVVPEALARCLWIGALTDREITQLSRKIEV